MTDVRLKTEEYVYEGRVYTLTCNMNVLADVQEAYGGSLMQALNRVKSLRVTLEFLAAMLNDAADTQDLRDEDGRLLHVTARQLGRKLSLQETTRAGKLVTRLIIAAMPESKKSEDEEDEEKN